MHEARVADDLTERVSQYSSEHMNTVLVATDMTGDSGMLLGVSFLATPGSAGALALLATAIVVRQQHRSA